MSRFSGFPVVEIIPEITGGKIYRLKETLGYRTAILDDYPNIIIYAGFESDGASVPRAFWRCFPPSGQYLGAAIVHDWLCETRICSSKDSAKIFLEAMIDLGVPKVVRMPMYWAVRWFGPKF